MRAIGREDLVDDDRLHTMIGRFMHAAEVEAVLHGFTRSHTAAEIEAACSAARVPVAIVGNGRVLLEHEHLQAREVFVAQPGEQFRRPRGPFRFHGVEPRPLAPAPDTPYTGSAGESWPRRVDRAAGLPGVGAPPLEGVRVCDFTAFWAGPFATAYLRALGAEVIKVEAVQRPDGIRFSASVPPSKDERYYEMSALFHAVNLGKSGVTIDLAQADGVQLAKELIASCDVVCENFTPRVLDDFGLDYDAVRAIRPDVIMMRMPAFGLGGPWRDRPGFAQTMEQLSGMAWRTGYEGGPPIIPGGVVDPLVGAHAALALIAAIEHRDRTGDGQLLEIAMIDVAVGITADQVLRWQITGRLDERRGVGGVYRCAGDDEWVAIDRVRDPLPPADRAAWCATRSSGEAAAALLADAIPAVAMVSAERTLDDPQLRARGYFEEITHPVVGSHWYPTWPVRFSAGPHRYVDAPAPMLGEHNEAVFGALGIDSERLAVLRAAAVIGDRPVMG
jgi:crotonobetainyl-CoA:carnitine CoA-transferase CaiB-like acyl-CoA transferase